MQHRSPALGPQAPPASGNFRSPVSPQLQPTAEKAQRVYREYIDENNQVVQVVANNPYVCTSTPEVTPQHRAQNPCKHFLLGHCSRGTACRFHHPDVELSVVVHMGTPRRSPPLGPKAVSPGGVTDDGPEPPAMVLPPAAMVVPSPNTIVSMHRHDPYLSSPQQRFSTPPEPVFDASLYPVVRLPCAQPPPPRPAGAALAGPVAAVPPLRETTPIYSDDLHPGSCAGPGHESEDSPQQ